MISAGGRTGSGSLLDAIGHAYDRVLAGLPLQDITDNLAQMERETARASWRPIAVHADRLATLCRLLKDRHDDAQSRLAILDRLPFGILILDVDGRMRASNRLGRTLLDTYPTLAAERGAVTSVSVADGAIDRLALANDRLPFRAARVTEDGRTIWLISWRVSKPSGVTGPRDSIIVALSDGHGLAPSQVVLQACFGLTPAESRVTALVASGRGTAEVARALRISRNAVRFHVKHVLSKTSIGRRADLVRALLISPAGLLDS